MRGRLDHDAQHRLRAALAHEDASLVAEPLGDGLLRRNDRGVIERGVFVIDLHIRKLLRVLAHRRGQLGERFFAVEHDLHELDGRQQSVTSIGIFAENNVPGLFAADQVSVGAHILRDVFITYGRLFIADAGLVERLVQAEVGHNRRDDLGIAEAALGLHVARADIEDLVAVDDRTVFIHSQAAVSVAVKGKAHVQPVETDVLLQVLNMRRAAVAVDIRAVRFIADDIRIRTERVKDVLCHHPRAAVGAVKADLHALVRVRGQADEITDVAVAAGGIVLRAADVRARGKRDLQIAVEIVLDLVNDALFHLLTGAVEQLDAIVRIGIVARADHDAAVKIVRTDDVGHARRRRHVHEIGVCARGRQAGGQRIFKHIAGSAGIFADHDRALVRPAVVPAEKPADPVGVFHRQAHVGLTAEAVGTEIFGHGCFPPIKITRKLPRATIYYNCAAASASR